LDFNFNANKNGINGNLDLEWKGIDFLKDNLSLQEAWEFFWPGTGNIPNWDAVGKIQHNSKESWILVEAKSHIEEIKQACMARPGKGLNMINKAFSETKEYLKIPESTDWLRPYYQYCNRIATLYFLKKHDVSAHLLFVYFLGDQFDKKICPESEKGWKNELNKLKQHNQILGEHGLSDSIHELFIDVRGKNLHL
jgi:hypothetical protein